MSKHPKHPDPFLIDAENPEWTAEDFARAKPMKETMPEVVEAFKRMRGRPPVENPKQPISIRIDAEVLAAFKATGEGWQSRMNDVLREHKPS